jgi:hypothetical protein
MKVLSNIIVFFIMFWVGDVVLTKTRQSIKSPVLGMFGVTK